MPDSWFESLFKFNKLNFAEGEIGFLAGNGVTLVLVILGVLVVLFFVVYGVSSLFTSNKSKAVSLGLRIPALLLLGLPLLEPSLIIPDVIPDENFVAVVLDTSESMTIPDGTASTTRLEEALKVLLDEDDGINTALDELFNLRYYTFDEGISRVDSVQNVTARGKRTNLSMALDRVLSDFSGIPLSGVVLITDGGDNSQDVPLNQAEALRDRDIPLHIVGMGQVAFEQEREILEAVASKSVEETTGADLEVKVRSWVAETEPVLFELFDGEKRVFSESRRLKGQGMVDQLSFFYEPEQIGAREYTLRIAEAPGEQNLANNSRNLLIDSRKDTLRVLYIQGKPNKEFKFVKRTMEDDQVIQVSSVIRTGTSQYYRQGIRSRDELSGGFAQSRSELYGFNAVLLGDIEAGAFTLEQMDWMESFVRVRGGGLLMLGGQSAFAEGDYENTPISDLLPVTIDPSRRQIIPASFRDMEREPEEQGYRFTPTAVGMESPVMKLSPEESTNRSLWSSMPGLTTINFLGRIKPGAVVLAEKDDDAFGASEPILAVQRYGAGRSAALASSSTWRWQMHLEAEDRRHERFWSQLVRWLVAMAPDPVDVKVDGHRFAPGDDARVTVRVYDPDFFPVETAEVTGYLEDPFGGVNPIVFQPDLTEAGSYEARIPLVDPGVYSIEAQVFDGDSLRASNPEHFLVRPSGEEYFDATQKKDFLIRLAGSNDGYYYTPEEADQIPDALRSRKTSTSVYRAEYLWDMPALWLLILLLLSAEWVYRRRKGLP